MITIVFASTPHNPEQEIPIYGIICFLEVNKEVEFPLFFPYTSFRSRLIWIAVDFSSLNPVWYNLDSIIWGQLSLTLARMAFSIILDI